MGRALQPEDRISHYRVVAPLGAGGMGEVYVAQDESLERSVALKTLPPHLVSNEERVRRFVTEARSASSLNHPNIVTIYEIGRDEVKPGGSGGSADGIIGGPIHFIAMELVSGDTLSQKIHHEKTDLRTLLGYIAQAAEGVAKAHAAGIIHRDLKPGNIMISRDGFAKVLDFGLAKLTEKQPLPDSHAGNQMTNAPTAAANTGEGVLMGTVAYMSPEQVQGKSADHRSDIFAMGCVLYEAATRRRPFVADTDVEVMHQILRERPAPVEELNPEIPGEVRRLIRRCMAKNPDERLQSMRDLAIELREIVDEYDTLAPATASGSTMSSRSLTAPPARRKGLAAGLAALALVGLGGLAVWLYGLRGGAGSSPASGLQQMKISVLMSRNNLAEAVLSGDGRYLAFVTNDAGKSSLNVRQVRTGSDVQIMPPQEHQIRGISFSRDGDYLFFRNRDLQSPNYSALYQVASLGGTPRKVIFDVDTAAAFSPDGKRICFRRGFPQDQADTLVVASLESGEEKELIRVKPPELFYFSADGLSNPPAWSPDGRTIAVPIFSTAGGVRSQIVTIDSETGARKELGSKSWVLVNSLGWLADGSAILASAFDMGNNGFQIYRIGYPDGKAERMTNDLTGYGDISISSDGRSVAAIQRADINNIHVAALEGGAPPQPVTFASGVASSVQLIAPLDDGGIAFTAPQGDNVFVWRVDADGSNRRQLTTGGVYVNTLLGAGKAGLVYSQFERDGTSHVWRMDSDGSGIRQLTNGAGEDVLAVSPDGRTLLTVNWANRLQFWSLSLEGGEPKLMVPLYDGGEPLFTPDGGRLLYSAYEMVEGRMYPRRYVIPTAGGEPVARFVCPPGSQDLQWKPDGKAVTYIDRDSGYNLMMQDIAGGVATRLTGFDSGRLVNHEWAPDGSRIALHRIVGQEESLLILRPGSDEPRMVAPYKTGNIRAVRWAADSGSLVFTYGTSNQDVVLISGF